MIQQIKDTQGMLYRRNENNLCPETMQQNCKTLKVKTLLKAKEGKDRLSKSQ